MARLTLKNLLQKNKEVEEMVHSWIRDMDTNVTIEDTSGKLLLGQSVAKDANVYTVSAESETLGYVKGPPAARHLAGLLSILAVKEEEKKKLGNEVLNLYQEINLIFDYSEKLAETIEPVSIARMALDESRHIIKADFGLILLLTGDDNETIQELASFGPPFVDREIISDPESWIRQKIRSGQSEIISDTEKLTLLGRETEKIQVLLYSPLKVKHQVMGAFFLASKEHVAYSAADLKLLTTLSLQSSAAIDSALLFEKNLQEAHDREEALRKIHEVTKKFVPHEFIRSLGKNTLTDVKLGDQVEREVTVLFTDIRDYTSIAEKMTPDVNFRFISYFNEMMGPIIRQHEGFVIQYLGDAIMAIFPQNPAEALSSAVTMQKALQDFNRRNLSNHLPVIQTGIGMHTGPLIMGITGDEYRLDATTISDAVNTAARIESLTKYFRTNILLTEVTLQQMPSIAGFHIRHLGRVQVKGKSAPVSIYECFSGYQGEELDKRIQTLSIFEEAMRYYQEGVFPKAESLFQQILQIHSTDQTARLYMDKASKLARSGIPENWSGVEEMITK